MYDIYDLRMAIYDHLWLFMTIDGYLWLCMLLCHDYGID
jgi:hypothetical protein